MKLFPTSTFCFQRIAKREDTITSMSHFAQKNLEEAFYLLCNRLMSRERRDRLLQKWNNLKFSDFMQGKNATGHSSLREMCSTANAIQLQLGPSSQDDQHLRDVLLSACKDEPWYDRLATMEIRRLIHVEESIASAISAEEGFRLTKKIKTITPAYIKGVNYVKDRPGMPSRKLLKNTSQQQDRKKNPVVNYRRLLS